MNNHVRFKPGQLMLLFDGPSSKARYDFALYFDYHKVSNELNIITFYKERNSIQQPARIEFETINIENQHLFSEMVGDIFYLSSRSRR